MLLTDRIIKTTLLSFIPHSVTANHITTFRFATIPFILLLLTQGKMLLATILFTIAAFSDAVDGALARTRNQETDWGKVFDPLADKILIGSTAVVLIPKLVNLYLALAIIVVELLISMNAYRKYGNSYKKGNVPQADSIGKGKMVLQSMGLGLLLISSVFGIQFFLTAGTIFLSISLVFAFASLIKYNSV